jgi:predicted O-linked N-acetylglucosamine transferase (SPINDLY family)
MAPETYYLAHARLAPVQLVSFGHPDTTGIDTLDYFVSSSLIEPDNADNQYSERLIRFNRLPCYYQPLIVPGQIPSRISMGLPEQTNLYGCPQSLFKFHPDFDAILLQIVENDPKGQIILIEGTHSGWTDLLKARWVKSCPALKDRAIFLPRMSLERFMALLAHIDVLLDPIHFGSGNTMYESMAYGTPTVTWPGHFMRGRLVAGAYGQMGIQDAPVASQLSDYASIAVELGKNPDRRMSLKEQILNSVGGSLYADDQAVREFEEFFIAAIDAADKGEKLPMGWVPLNMSRSFH